MRRIGHRLAVVALAIGLGSGLAQADPFRPSRQQQIELGQQASAQVRRDERILPANHPRTRFIQEIGQRLVSALPENEREPWKFTFGVIDRPEVNAFALPGGPIYFFNGLIDRLTTVDEFAGIMAHEIMHITHQHWAHAYAERTKRRLGLAVLFSLTNANRDLQNTAGLLEDVFLALPHSRRHESQADREGVQLMIRAGFNPQGMADVMRMFGEISGRTPEFVSTHPDPLRRANEIEAQVRAMNRDFDAQTPLPADVRRSATGQGIRGTGG